MQEPQTLIPEQRRRALRDALQARTVLSIREAAELLNVSHMTVRRDIVQLEHENLALGIPGGVRLLPHVGNLPPVERAARANLQMESKRAIAREAGKLITDGMFVFLDAGTTCEAVVPHLAERRDVTIVTSDLFIAVDLLPHPHIRTIQIGGDVDKQSGSTGGAAAVEIVRAIRLDLCFISTGSWTLDGVTTSTQDKYYLKRAALDASERSVLVADSSKFGATSRYRVAELERFDGIITDEALQAISGDIRNSGPNVTTARH